MKKNEKFVEITNYLGKTIDMFSYGKLLLSKKIGEKIKTSENIRIKIRRLTFAHIGNNVWYNEKTKIINLPDFGFVKTNEIFSGISFPEKTLDQINAVLEKKKLELRALKYTPGKEYIKWVVEPTYFRGHPGQYLK